MIEYRREEIPEEAMLATLAKLGEDGWELVAAHHRDEIVAPQYMRSSGPGTRDEVVNVVVQREGWLCYFKRIGATP